MYQSLLKFLKAFWGFIDSLNTHIKSILILVFLLFIFYIKVDIGFTKIRNILLHHEEAKEYVYEKYTRETAENINEIIQLIEQSDGDCFNVLLLSYHNSKKSVQGYRYLFLNCISESPKSISDNFVKQYWEELNYIYYAEEVSKIHKNGFTEVYSDDLNFPRLSKHIALSDAKKAAFYPLDGVDSPIGLVVILYKDKSINNYGKKRSIYQRLQKLSIMLDVSKQGLNV